jgi:hypothetical protein
MDGSSRDFGGFRTEESLLAVENIAGSYLITRTVVSDRADKTRKSGREVDHGNDHPDHCQPDQSITNLSHGGSPPTN